jgi:hypothetical protein
MRLSENFYLNEFTKSQTASRRGIDNTPGQAVVDNIKNLCIGILQPLRERLNRAILISSGFRCLALNRAVGSSDNSQHVKGQAVDFSVNGWTNREIIELIVESGLDFDQIIDEFSNDETGEGGWIHLSYVTHRKNRGRILKARRVNGKVVYTEFRQ